MAKDYKHVPKPGKEKNGSIFNGIMTFLTGLAVGLFSALFIYLNQSDSSYIPFMSKTQDQPQAESGQSQDSGPPVSESGEPPGPRFDFYNILPNKELNISEWIAEDQALSSTNNNENNVYILQVGSFNQPEAADQIKAQLALLGIVANIQRVVINGQDTRYRVRVGPYTDQKKLNEERRRLQENNLEFMLLKLQEDDPTINN